MRLHLPLVSILAAAGSYVHAAPAKYSAQQLLVATADNSSDLYERRVDFNWGSDKVRGVNLGGWLVLEA